MPTDLILVFLLALLAFTLSSLSGGGASLLLFPLLRTLLLPAQVPAALTMGTAASSVSRLAVFRTHIRWDFVRWFVPAALPAVWLGAWLLTYANPFYVEVCMGVFMVANLPLLLKSGGAGAPEPPRSPKAMIALTGFLTGFVSGLTGAVGLLFNRFYLRFGLTKEEIVATRAANESLLHLVKLGLYLSFGLFTPSALLYGLVIAAAGILSAWLSKAVLAALSNAAFRRIGYGSMVLAGVFMLYSATAGIARANNLDFQYEVVMDGGEAKFLWNKKHQIALELEFGEGFEFEQSIGLQDLPRLQQAEARKLIAGADDFLIEEGFGYRKHFYEVYVVKNGQVVQHELADN